MPHGDIAIGVAVNQQNGSFVEATTRWGDTCSKSKRYDAVLALFLASFGLFAVLAHDVGQRTQEIGIRMALGALPRDVIMLVIQEALALTVFGLGVGLAGAAAVRCLMQALRFGVSPTEPLVFAALAVLLFIVALLACWVPARRAMRMDPLQALRQD